MYFHIHCSEDTTIQSFGEKYKQWNAAFDAGFASALNKSMIVIHGDEHQHALKEVDGAAMAVAEAPNQVVQILDYAYSYDHLIGLWEINLHIQKE